MSAEQQTPSSGDYALIVNAGTRRVESDTATVVNLTGDDPIETLVKSNLTAADLRTRTLFLYDPSDDPTDVQRTVAVYAALCGLAGRMIDHCDGGDVLDARTLHGSAKLLPDSGKPAEPVETFELTTFDTVTPSPSADGEPSSGGLGGVTFDVETVTSIRYARTLRVPFGSNSSDGLHRLVIVGGIRARNNSERFPTMLVGSETVDLDELRRQGAALRRERRIDDRNSLADMLEPTARTTRLIDAAKADLSDVLTRLGSVQNVDNGFWRCPRPTRHRNGDANPSAKITDSGFRCYRCDSEPVDALRLVVDSLGLGPDDAAGWILTA